jgi:putative ABC transport system substrate-binding protein
VRDRVDIIAVWQTPAALAAKGATRDIPIVMLAVGNPLREGIVASLARPGGNITGTDAEMTELGTKNLELLTTAPVGEAGGGAEPRRQSVLDRVPE